MKTEFRKAEIPKDLRSLVAFDRKVFSLNDSFTPSDWKTCEAYWLLVNDRKVGCCAFVRNSDIDEPRKGSLYIMTTGILPGFQGKGFGALLKSWQIAFARHHGFTRIVTNSRESNAAMHALNKRFKFKVVRKIPHYYNSPDEATIVMELLLGA